MIAALRSQVDIEGLCRMWQQRLRLQDWDITVAHVPVGVLSGPAVHGDIVWKIHSKSAHIRIVQSVDMAANDPHYDQENTVVHELLHLHFIGLGVEDDTPADIVLEQAIWAIARALVGQSQPRTIVGGPDGLSA